MKNLAVWRIDQSGTPPGGQAPLLTPVERSHLGLEKHLVLALRRARRGRPLALDRLSLSVRSGIAAVVGRAGAARRRCSAASRSAWKVGFQRWC